MLLVLIRFALLGSFVGGGVFLTVRGIADANTISNLGEIGIVLAESLPLAVLASFLSVPLGFVPAVFTGVCYWYALQKHTKQNLRPFQRLALGGGIGLLASTLFGLLFSFSDAPGAYHPIVNLVSWACAGLFGGGLSALAVSNSTYTNVVATSGVSNEA